MEKNCNFKVIYFDDIVPRLQLERKEADMDYHKAFLEREDKEMSEYCKNTTTWE